MKINVIFVAIFLISLEGYGQESVKGRKFEQMETMLPTPNSYRTASGAPGHEYWQQKADYVIDVELNDENQTISGYEVITYTNNSPDPLSYFWLQLEQNMRNVDSDSYSTANSYINQDITEGRLKSLIGHSFDLGFNILEVKDMKGNDLPYNINKTMMRVNLPETIHKGQQFIFSVKWN
ncbi:MAG: M1 family peptidase, partial [Cyclobacteriaceae bacterium]|nr:M1 family peptidase [Cyclobacteriaceae bacterium]